MEVDDDDVDAGVVEVDREAGEDISIVRGRSPCEERDYRMLDNFDELKLDVKTILYGDGGFNRFKRN